jgi:hypothetical protein
VNTQAWVAQDAVASSGDCDLVTESEAPPVVFAAPRPEPTNPPAVENPPGGGAPPGQDGGQAPPPAADSTQPPQVPCYSVGAGVDPAGSGSVAIQTGPNCGGQYRAGTGVTFSAAPSGWKNFTGWSGCGSGGANPITVTINGSCTMIAHFN